MNTEPGFEEVEHTADWALHVRGRTLRELFVNAARGLSHLLAPDMDRSGQEFTTEITVDAYDAESLLVNWLTELAFWAETEQIVFGSFAVEAITTEHLRATVQGNQLAGLQKHVKAVTYHNLQIVETADGLEATVVFDV